MEYSTEKPDTIVVLEDDEVGNRLMCAHLRRAGFQVHSATTIEGARQLLSGGTADLLLLDYQLGEERTGLDFYRELQGEGIEPPAILVTGFSDEERLVEALRAGVRDYILKTPNFMELITPVIERVLREVQSERRLIEAEAAGRAKDHFLATLSHELRTPLTPVLALVSALLKDDRLPSDVAEDIATIHRNVELEARLIDDMLDLTRIARGKLELRLETVDIRPSIEHAVKTCCAHEAAEKMIECHHELAGSPHMARVDPARLTQVLWNLLKNAIKFTPVGGRIWVRSQFEQRDDQQWLAIEVRDTGIGVSPEVMPHIFGAFEQGDIRITRRFGGLGLGLAISKAIVDSHGGTISAASGGPDQGAIFTLHLPPPDAEARQERPKPTTQEWERVRDDTAHLLLVEDHADTAHILARMLRRSGFHVTVATNVAQALAVAQVAQEEVDDHGRRNPIRLVISDLGLPDGSGHDLMKELGSRYRLRGIALSGFGMEDDRRRAEEAGFAQHITKPVEIEHLLAAIRELTVRT